jgi:hypothetical protein
MIRLLAFLIVVFAVGLGFAWLADRPGDMLMNFNGYQYEVSLMVAAVAVTAVVAALLLSWWVAKAVWNSPYTIARYFRVRRRDRGYQALSTGMIAARDLGGGVKMIPAFLDERKGNRWNAEKIAFGGGRHGAGVQCVLAHVRAIVDARDDQVGTKIQQARQGNMDAVRRRAIDIVKAVGGLMDGQRPVERQGI